MLDLSIIVPLHNEERRIEYTLQQLTSYLPNTGLSYEILLVDNGSADQTSKIAYGYEKILEYVTAFTLPMRGKGIAVRLGMINARGAWRMMCDCDFSMPVDQIDSFLDARDRAEVIIGSRRRTGVPIKRRLISWTFNKLVNLLVLHGAEDSQSGYKMFSERAAIDIFIRQEQDGLAFDVELLCIARQLGYQILEIPIDWRYDPDSRVRLARDSWQMVRALWQIRNAHLSTSGNPARMPQVETTLVFPGDQSAT